MPKLDLLTLSLSLTLAVPCLPAALLAAPPAESANSTAYLRIEGMVTSACPVLVKSAAGSIAGVRRVEASLEKKTASIEYDASKTSVEEIIRIILDRTGLQARPIKNR